MLRSRAVVGSPSPSRDAPASVREARAAAPPRRRTPALAAAILGMLLALASGCGGGGSSGGRGEVGGAVALQDDRLPVVPMSEIAGRVALLRDTRVRISRVDLLWSDIAPTRPANPDDPASSGYDFDRADTILRGFARSGITPIVCVYSSPAWAAGGLAAPGPGPVNPNAPDPAEFGRFMGALSRRYDGKSRDASGRRLPRVVYFELWNEPDLSAYMTPQHDSRGRPVALDRYAAMVRAAYPRIKRSQPRAVVIAGAGAPRSSTSPGGIAALDWLRGLRARRIPLDAYSQHIYPAAPPLVESPAVPSWSSLPLLLDEVARFGAGVPLFITEAGYTTAPTPVRKTSVTEDEQATYLKQVYSLSEVRDRKVAVVVWFNLQDNSLWPGGLLRIDGPKKPSYAAFLDVARDIGLRTLPR
jgi:polysaccharide biosynthesis protein PslG